MTHMTRNEAVTAMKKLEQALQTGTPKLVAYNEFFGSRSIFYAWKKKLKGQINHGEPITIIDEPTSPRKFIISAIKSQLRSIQEMLYELEKHS